MTNRRRLHRQATIAAVTGTVMGACGLLGSGCATTDFSAGGVDSPTGAVARNSGPAGADAARQPHFSIPKSRSFRSKEVLHGKP